MTASTHAQVKKKEKRKPAGRDKRRMKRQGGKGVSPESSTFLPKSSSLLEFLSESTIAPAGRAATKIHFVVPRHIRQTWMGGWFGRGKFPRPSRIIFGFHNCWL